MLSCFRLFQSSQLHDVSEEYRVRYNVHALWVLSLSHILSSDLVHSTSFFHSPARFRSAGLAAHFGPGKKMLWTTTHVKASIK